MAKMRTNYAGIDFIYLLNNALGLYLLKEQVRLNLMAKPPVTYHQTHTAGRMHVWLVWLLAIALLISTGITYRVMASHLKLVTHTPIKLPVPLSDFPAQLDNWAGKDVPIRQTIQQVAGNDDFLNRLYTNKLNNQWVNFYVAYTARPRTMLGHRPQVCYVAGGWIHDGTYTSQVISNSGRKVPCLVHRFHTPGPEREDTVVLNFYIVNGQLTSDESVFSGVGWRTPNISGNPARYVAQVQISSVLENSTRKAAQDMTDLLLDFLPDENGNVKAAKPIIEPNNTIK